MKYTTIVFYLVLLVLASCGTNKKLQTAEQRQNELQAKNADLQKANDLLTQHLADEQSQKNAMSAEYASYKKECTAAQEKVLVWETVLEQEADDLEELEKKIDKALEDFAEKGVMVYYENGLVRVSLEDDLLFKSGSAKLDDNGKKALAALASVLNDYPKLKVIVVGNTDDAKLKKGLDAWTLSTERANGVVRTLRDTYNVEPTRLTAAGKGKYNPVADNSTAAGRARNRRIDIVINPDIDRLWDSVRHD
jgi:chemotaxis protein MotB